MTTRRSVLLLLPALVIACPNCNAAHDKAFWKSIAEHSFAVPPDESVGSLTLEIADLAASTDPTLRDKYGYEILAAWIYRDHKLDRSELEPLRKKLLPAMVFHIGESGTDTIFQRSFSALYVSLLAAEDLNRPFLSASAFQETFDSPLRCYAEEKDLRGYVPGKGWAHATAHVADLLKFLARNEKISPDMQKRIVASVAQRSRTAGIVFTRGEDARMAEALLSVANRNDFDTSGFNEWFSGLVTEHKALWQAGAIDPKAYASVRVQANVLSHFAGKIAGQKGTSAPSDFRTALHAALLQVD